MRIGINARFLTEPYTGIGKYTYNLLKALSKFDYVNEYFLFTPELVDFPLPGRFKQIRVPEGDYQSDSFRKFHWEQKLVPLEMEKWKIGLAHFLYPSNPNKKMNIPTIVTVHDAIPWKLPHYNRRLRSKLYHWNAKMALKKADHLLTVSNFSKGELESLLPLKEGEITVTPLAAETINLSDIPQELELRRKYLLYVGGYDYRKNVPLLMIAYQKFIANHYPIDLILVNGKNWRLESYITDAFTEKIAGNIPVKPKGKMIFTDPLSDEELAALYKKAAALVHASHYEGFNLPLVEAMKHGLPMVVADIPVNREVAGDAAFYVDPTDEDTFGLGLHSYLNNQTLQKELAKNSLRRSSEFDWAKTAQQTWEIYKQFDKSATVNSEQ